MHSVTMCVVAYGSVLVRPVKAIAPITERAGTDDGAPFRNRRTSGPAVRVPVLSLSLSPEQHLCHWRARASTE